MYYSVTGKLIHTGAFLAVVDCAGVGYKCITTLTTLSCLPPVGDTVTLFTHLNVREDALDLYGFYTMDELEAFRLLIGVSGVGPKSALAVLSDLTPDRLALSIASGDSKSLTRAPGIGPKAAQRIILELKDKITDDALLSGTSSGSTIPTREGSNLSEASSALCALGYSPSEAAKALAGAAADLPVDELVRMGLRALAGGRR